MNKKYYLIIMLLCNFFLHAQEYFPKNDGVKNKNTNYTAFTNAKIYISPSQVIEKGILLIKADKVISSGTNVSLPQNTIRIDLDGKSIYPSFIDIYSDFGIEKPKRNSSAGRSPQFDTSRTGYYWNDHIMPEQKATDKFKFDPKKAEALRNAGFGVVNTHIQEGIVRGN